MITLYVGGYGSEKLYVAFTEQKDVRLLVKGEEKVQEPVTFEYEEDGKMVAKITLSFPMQELDGFIELAEVIIVGGYRQKKYHAELTKVVNLFIENELEIKAYNFNEEVKNRETSIYSGKRAYREDGQLEAEANVVSVSYDKAFDSELSYFESSQASLWVSEGVVYEKVNEPLRSVFFMMQCQPGNPSRLIVNGSGTFHSIGVIKKK